MQQFDLIIVGGGLAGASLAVALRKTHLRIALVEGRVPIQPEGWDARIYAISPANQRFLEQIGTWEHLDNQRITPIQAMEIFGDQGGKLNFSAFDTGVSELGWIMESSLMACEFWESLKRQANLTRFCPATPIQLKVGEDATTLTLNDGKELSARLLIGADGRDSWIRQQAGLEAITTPYGDKGLVANFATEKPHRGIAYQWFRHDGILAYLPLSGRRMSIVWSAPDALADELCTLPPETLAARVAEAGAHTLGALEVINPPAAFPLRLIRVPRTVSPRLALVGDAAHGIHPLSGHGINLGFQDARLMAELLSGAPVWQDIGDIRFLERYQRARKEETVLMQTSTHALNTLFKGTLPGLPALRNLGLSATNKMGPIKNLLVRYALGNL